MELYIRSQNRLRLVKVNGDITITHSLEPNYHMYVDITYIGEYKTEERALEVLDEIQNMIKPKLINTEYHSEIKQGVDNLSFDVVMTPIEDKITYIQPNVVVYEMPKE